MKVKWKLLMGFLCVSILSAGVAVGAYSYLIKNDNSSKSSEFRQTGFYPVGYNVAAENTDFTLAAEQSVNAVVHIKSVAKPSERNNNDNSRGFFDPFEFFFGQSPQFQRQPRVGFGSGVIISTDGYIVTNNHVVDGADELEVTTNDDQVYKAKLIGADDATDVALLKIEGKNFPVIPFGDSDRLKIGEWVLAVGNPFNLTSTVTAGIVSAKGRGSILSGGDRYGNRTQQNKVESFIQTDAAVNPGNSGGALVNTRGELVGINTAIYSETGNFVGYSFAVPINLVKKVISDIKEYGVVQRALLGVTVTELDDLKEMQPDAYKKLSVHEGVYISGFSSNSSAFKAGLKEGDVIVAINGNKIKNYQELRAQISLYNPGNTVEVQVQRGSDLKKYNVELKNDQGTTAVVKSQSASEILGATFKNITPEIQKTVGVNYGIEVTGVTNGKLKEAGIKDGFIILTANDTRINSPEMFMKIVESLLKQDPEDRGLFLKGLYPDGKLRFIAIDLNG
ncbi:MAG: Do family serine endopeptidase [Candidatus Azobacteroides sp.]|nr:Do family serine endopeptidase [Candidatus Azobacteroides sp.]